MWKILGQDRVLSRLRYSLKANSVAHAYLLTGPRHVGKRTLALEFAQALNCQGSEQPCGECRSCQRIWESKHPDVILISLDSKAEIGIDDIRELQRLASLPPYEGKWKVFIIDDADYLSTEAANSLLKILEEPPPKVVWLLLTVEEGRLLPTIISRCQRLELKPISPREVREILLKNHKVENMKAELLARLCHGCLGWALTALADQDVLQQREQRVIQLSSLLTANLEAKLAYASELANQFSQSRKSVMEILRLWLDWWHDLLLIKVGCREALTNIDYEPILENQARALSLGEIKEFLSRLCSVQEHLTKNINPRLALEFLMLSLPGKTEL